MANSVYATSILTFIFPIYFKNVLIADNHSQFFVLGTEIKGESIYPFMVSFSLFLVLLLGSFLGQIADKNKSKKRFLFTMSSIGSTATASLFFLEKGDWQIGALLFLIANFCFVSGTIFYNALMKEIAQTEADTAKLSGLGWGIGYTGGFVVLLAQLALIMKPELVGIDKTLATQIAFLSSGIWWFVFTLPLMWGVQESKGTSAESEKSIGIIDSFKMMKELIALPALALFLGAFFFYNDAVQTTISQASTLANSTLNMELNEVMTVGVIIQLVAIIGSFAFLAIERKIGTSNALKISLINWALIMTWAMLMTHKWEFYILGIWVGLVMGVTQSASRTLFALYTPPEKSSVYFSFYSLADRAGSMVGPMLFALASQFIHIRAGIFPLLIMVLTGLYLLTRIKTSHTTSKSSL